MIRVEDCVYVCVLLSRLCTHTNRNNYISYSNCEQFQYLLSAFALRQTQYLTLENDLFKYYNTELTVKNNVGLKLVG